ncbi:DNA mismatch repair protein MutS [Blakeslea trispora]|nr:DNA mismatch repair protein MutS [Blakeslea trispora]
MTLRSFRSATPLPKRVSKLKLTELKVETIAAKPLEHIIPPTGSVVLDTVREFTRKYPQCVLLVQVGDFYELYESHAARYASQLDLKLTKKSISSGNVVDFAGFPLRSLDRYLDILVNRLQCKVALCEQLGVVTREDQSVAGIQRRITRVITPGTVIEERFLQSNQYNYLLSIYPHKDRIGLAWVDISVGEFIMQPTTLARLKDDLARIRPREVILPSSMKFSEDVWEQGLFDPDVYDPITRLLVHDPNITISYQLDDQFDSQAGAKTLNGMFQHLLPDFSQDELAAGMALMMYVNETHISRKPKWQRPSQFNIHDCVSIDSAAMSSLELLKSLQGTRTDSLLGVLDRTSTSAGSRLLTRWISSPLMNANEIKRRLDIVEIFRDDPFLLDEVRAMLKSSTDAQRALQRLALRRGQHSDLMDVWNTLDLMQKLNSKLSSIEDLQEFMSELDPHTTISTHIQSAFDYEQIQNNMSQGYGFVNPEFHPTLVRLRRELKELEAQRFTLQTELRSLCGNSLLLITDGPLKHLVEVNTRQAKHLVERFPHAISMNHTKSKKRYQIEDWTNISIRLDSIQSQVIQVESEVFEEIVEHVLNHSASILQSCRHLAQLDVLTCFAHLSLKNNYVRPRMTRTQRTLITGGRHPVVEFNLARKGQSFVTNDCDIGPSRLIWLLTGPNMGGKSTFLRQYAIIVIMAHMGCFVPADRAWIGITDKVFSRVGAADNLAQNQSTFMVEMSEVATILSQATSKSTVIMDEVGRGTSTKDGLSLAFGIVDYLHERIKCRTIFATHYHELASTMSKYSDLKCYCTQLEVNSQGTFRFIHKVQPGICEQSHGLKVAQMAGLPAPVLQKAQSMWDEVD